jgi:hypothetical protein
VRVAVCALCVTALGCNGEDDDGHVHGDPALEQPPDDCPSDLPQFTANRDDGYEVTGERGAIKARLVDASDVPPRLNRNDWTIRITDPDGTPLAGADVAQACAYMPDHAHAETPRAVIAEDGPGEFTLEFLNLNMTGLWHVDVAVRTPRGDGDDQQFTRCDQDRRYPGDDLVVFRACIPR